MKTLEASIRMFFLHTRKIAILLKMDPMFFRIYLADFYTVMALLRLPAKNCGDSVTLLFHKKYCILLISRSHQGFRLTRTLKVSKALQGHKQGRGQGLHDVSIGIDFTNQQLTGLFKSLWKRPVK